MDFETIYTHYYKDVLHFLTALTKDTHLAEELTQDTFFKALAALDQYKEKVDVRRWLFTIGRNGFYTHLRKQKKSAFLPPEEMEQLPETGVSFEQRLDSREEALRLHTFLHEMPEPYKEVFNLRVFGELPFADIIRIFGKSESWSRVTFFRARLLVQRWLEQDKDRQEKR